MKANAPKRKVFQDAVDLLTEDLAVDKAVAENGVIYLPIDKIKAFRNHPFRLYEGERLDDMVDSIREHGVLNPTIVRRTAAGYEMLAGHNRMNAAKLAGLTEIPAIVKDRLTDAEAYVYVIETNLMQRSFTDLSVSEKAAVLAERYDKVLYQRKKDEIIEELQALEGYAGKGGHRNHLSEEKKDGHSDHHLNRESLGEEYGLSGSSVARLLRVNRLIPEFKEMLDDGQMQLMAAVQLSYLPEEVQRITLAISKEVGVQISKKMAAQVRVSDMTEATIREVVTGKKQRTVKPDDGSSCVFKPIRLSAGIREKYFSDTDSKEIEDIVDQALAAWFGREGAGADV